MRTRRAIGSLAAFVAVVSLATGVRPSRADGPTACEPSRFALFGEDSYFTTRGTPGHVFFRVENRSPQTVAIELVRLVLVQGERETRVAIRSVRDDASGDELGRRLSLAVDQRRRLRVHIAAPEGANPYLFRGTFVDGTCRYEADSQVTFAHRSHAIVR